MSALPAAAPTAPSISVSDFAVMVAAIWSPIMIDRAEVASCERVIVSVSDEMFVTRTISAFDVVGCELAGHTVALKGVAGNFDPSPDATTSDVPDEAGDGAVATVEYAKFLWAS